MCYVDDPYAAAEDADALLILSDWQEFSELDLDRLHYTLRYPIVIDGRNLYDPAQMVERGFTYLSVERPASHQTRECGGSGSVCLSAISRDWVQCAEIRRECRSECPLRS